MAAHRWWRFQSTDSGRVFIEELEFRASIGGVDETDSGGFISGNGTSPSNAFDNTTAVWSTNDAAGNFYVVVDFGSGNVVDIVELALSTSTSFFPANFNAAWSDDGVAFTTQKSFIETLSAGTTYVYSLAVGAAVLESPPSRLIDVIVPAVDVSVALQPSQSLIDVTVDVPVFVTSTVVQPAALVIDVAVSVMAGFTIALDKDVIQSRRYSCVITGAADGLADSVIPISSLSLRATNKGISTLIVVCPNGVDYAALIAERSNGGLIITASEVYADGSEDSTSWDEYAISALSSSQGASSHSIVLTSKFTLIARTPRRINLSGVSLITTDQSGSKRVRANPDKDLLPDDVAVIDGVEITVTQVTTYISQDGVNMEVSDG